MADKTFQLSMFPNPADDQTPLPELIIKQLNGTMESTDTVDGKRLYCIQDWVFYVSGSQARDRSSAWRNLKRELTSKRIKYSSTPIPRPTSRGFQSVEFTDAQGLYQITQRMSDQSETVIWVKKYLAKAGVFVDEARINPEEAITELQEWMDKKEYRRLIAEGFSDSEARQWLERRSRSKSSRKRQTTEWKRRGVDRGWDFGRLTNEVNTIALGDSATQQKQDYQLKDKDTARNYYSAAELAMLEVTESLSTGLHVARDSQGVDQLSEDIQDTEPMINRTVVYAKFSQKRRRLPAEKKPSLPDKKM